LWNYSKKTKERKGKGNGRKKHRRRKEAREWEDRRRKNLCRGRKEVVNYWGLWGLTHVWSTVRRTARG